MNIGKGFKDMMPKQVAFVGNFSVPFSTESHLKWTFEKLGWKVIPIQENETTANEILNKTLTFPNAQLFVWVRTHSWDIPGDMLNTINKIKEYRIPTVAFHLDRYWGLDVNDKRETLVGSHLWWSMDYVFTADGGNQDKFHDRGVNHYYLPPAVVEYGCYRGELRPEYVCDVGFVGSKYYHPEYPERQRLIEWLEANYGHRFKRFAGDTEFGTVREQDLNDVYASGKIFVGDSCFAGAPFYWSDRTFETAGRGGFLIHPTTEGLYLPGMASYKPQDYVGLKKIIDYYLEHEYERNIMRDTAQAWVRKFDTYTNRIAQMLEIMDV